MEFFDVLSQSFEFTEKFSEHFEIPRALALAIDKELYQATGTESLYKGKIRNLLGHFVHRPDVDPREKTKIMEKLKSGDLKPLEFALLTDNVFCLFDFLLIFVCRISSLPRKLNVS